MAYFDEQLKTIKGERFEPLAEKPKGKLEEEVEAAKVDSKNSDSASPVDREGSWVSAIAEAGTILQFSYRVISGGVLLYQLDSKMLPYYVCAATICAALGIMRK